MAWSFKKPFAEEDRMKKACCPCYLYFRGVICPQLHTLPFLPLLFPSSTVRAQCEVWVELTLLTSSPPLRLCCSAGCPSPPTGVHTPLSAHLFHLTWPGTIPTVPAAVGANSSTVTKHHMDPASTHLSDGWLRMNIQNLGILLQIYYFALAVCCVFFALREWNWLNGSSQPYNA